MTDRGLPVSDPTRVHTAILHCVLQRAVTPRERGNSIYKSLIGATEVLQEQRGMAAFRAPLQLRVSWGANSQHPNLSRGPLSQSAGCSM